ncbi:hypothetical protein [Paracoccus sp. IB05]|uniref:hypothetical protein n=1 Tax=Paracoccus sp. IB05 TaxID=2779367 RepID=UPI0018E8CC49|nr:hypothetical protein [Paracoccus sp. IB05]MBJ2153598.1 hypothetical protein [Paracoccus sp. IB05]
MRLYAPAVIYMAEASPEGVVVYDDAGQVVFREVQRTHGFRDLPSEDKLGLWLSDYSDDKDAGAVTLTVVTDSLLDHGFLIQHGGTLYNVMAVKAGDSIGAAVKVLARAMLPPVPVLLPPDETWPVIPLPPITDPEEP